MAMPVTLRRFTVDEIDAFPDDGNRYELLDGVLFVTPAPGMPHQMMAATLLYLLKGFHDQEPGVFVTGPGVVEVAPKDRLEPDVLVGRLPESGTRWDKVQAWWLAVEVSGVGSRIYDRDYKRDGYLAIGVQEVWLVDLRAERIFVSRPDTAKDVPHDRELIWRSPGTGRELRIDVAALFRDAPPEPRLAMQEDFPLR